MRAFILNDNRVIENVIEADKSFCDRVYPDRWVNADDYAGYDIGDIVPDIPALVRQQKENEDVMIELAEILNDVVDAIAELGETLTGGTE